MLLFLLHVPGREAEISSRLVPAVCVKCCEEHSRQTFGGNWQSKQGALSRQPSLPFSTAPCSLTSSPSPRPPSNPGPNEFFGRVHRYRRGEFALEPAGSFSKKCNARAKRERDKQNRQSPTFHLNIHFPAVTVAHSDRARTPGRIRIQFSG